MKVDALTHKVGKIANVIKTPVKIINPFTKASLDTLAIWDTGATNCVITRSKAEELGLCAIQQANVRGVHGTQVVNVYHVKIILNNQNISLTTQVTECVELSDSNDIGMLIGMNLITKGDFCISSYQGQTTMTFRVPSVESTDYVQEIGLLNRCVKVHQINARKHFKNDKCACGSGKDYKNCHGKSKYLLHDNDDLAQSKNPNLKK